MLGSDFVTVFLTVLFIILIGKWFQERRGLPPGPWGLPVIGALWVMASGDPLTVFKRLREKYGNVFSIQVGSELLVVLNGYETIKEALVGRADDFSHRPNHFFNKEIAKGRGLLGSSGRHWKQTRTLSLAALREIGFGKNSLESKVKEEIEIFLNLIDDKHGKPFNITDVVFVSISNTICSIVLGNRFDHGDKEFKWLLEKLDPKKVSATNIANSIPILRFLPGDPFKVESFKKRMLEIAEYFQNCVASHKASFHEHELRDFIDVFIKEQSIHGDTDPVYRDDNMAFAIFNLFVAGTDSTSTTVRWSIIYILHNPKIQDRMFEEIKTVIGLSRAPTLADKQEMPYCSAVILEVLRMSNVVPLSVPHVARNDVDLRGFRIPRGAVIMPNLESVLKDPNLFPEPNKFRPARFLDSDGKYKRNEKVIAFSLGRRKCLGESLAMMEVFLFLTSFLQRFELKPAETLPSVEGIFGITYSPKPYTFRAVSRK